LIRVVPFSIVKVQPSGSLLEYQKQTPTAAPEISPSPTNENSARDQTTESVARATEAARQQGPIYLWEEGNVPTTTVYTENNSRYADPPDFRPNMVYYPAREGVEVKGAVLLAVFDILKRAHPAGK
jgi:hypothetical protein